MKKSDKEKLFGIDYVIEQLDSNEIISPADVKRFMFDLSLPMMQDDELISKIIDAGGSANGFTRLNEFFNFIKNEIPSFTVADGKKACKVFDKEESGVMSGLYFRDIVRNLGDGLNAEEADDFLRISDNDGDGMVSYEEVMTMLIETTFDPMMKDFN